ncbi:hypothetical protein [Luteibacter sp. 329MFSha]|uniref:hypothetical protein n=1 Tax=Luteibacter sp. 329MFSha TaxID=1798239 RepID=UPI0008BEAA35|nr:hypothetical protein [Luteibacter sp. 329MFSha]SEW25453.1 hypothetical protein SAMN04515660_3400 [Luteibacter sp. 329MFSha]
MSDNVLSRSAYSAVINQPVDKVDIAEWLFSLPSDEYKRCCPPDHIAAGSTWTDDGRRMSINVEMIGKGLVIQQYVAEVAEPNHCRMVSLSDVFAPQGRSRVQVIWDLSVEAIDETSCKYTNSVVSSAPPEYVAWLAENGMTIEQAAAARQSASSDHNSRETPLFAASIERRARANAGK